MELWYGSVALNVVDLVDYRRTNVYSPDGMDLIGVDHTIAVVGVLAPGGRPAMNSVTALSPDTVARMTGDDDTASVLDRLPRGADPGATRGVLPEPPMEPERGGVPLGEQFSGPESDLELHARLMTPRQKLILWAHARADGRAIRWLESPRVGFAADAAGGPFPLSCDVVAASGEPHSVGVLYQVQTRQTPCPTGSDRLILSHRWEVSHTHDADFYMTRVTRGEVVFHAGVRDLLGVVPDWFRGQFVHPIPLGYRRGIPELTQSSDGLTIRYTITDTNPKIVFAPGNSGATEIEILERFTRTVPTTFFGSPEFVGQ
jgi:hypothetical protein